MSLFQLRDEPGASGHGHGHSGGSSSNSSTGGGHGHDGGEGHGHGGGDPNRRLGHMLTLLYPKQAVYLVVSFLFLVTLINVVSSIYTRYAIRRLRGGSQGSGSNRRISHDNEAQSSTRPIGVVDVRRLPQALLNLTRILAFRITIPVGFGVRLTSAEVLIPACHFAALMTWEFINCKPSYLKNNNKLSESIYKA